MSCGSFIDKIVFNKGVGSKSSLTLFEAAPELPIVPVTIDGSWQLLIHNLLPLPFGTEVRLSIGAPIERSEDEDPEALLYEVREQIEKTLEHWRSA